MVLYRKRDFTIPVTKLIIFSHSINGRCITIYPYAGSIYYLCRIQVIETGCIAIIYVLIDICKRSIY